ncbi:hypothetical protein A4G20_10530 [Pasteurellaceae bacterium RH1A]|nr:hypothetical protein A4G20_10530 [Pasteurellaceae bacterium RH1A]
MIEFILLIIFLSPYLIALFLAKRDNQKIKNDFELFFNSLSHMKNLIKIRKDLYYINGAYLNYEYLITRQNIKIKHYQKKDFIINLLKCC